MRPVVHLALVGLLACPAQAQDWQRLDEASITATLTAHPLVYEDGTEQIFFADGRTLYTAGSGESWGKWYVSDGRYCSTWPPGETPACYDVDLAPPQLRFVSGSGSETLGKFRE